MNKKLQIFYNAMEWIRRNTIDGNGITVISKQKLIYPEVTGYYIPSLLRWGERDLAISYSKYLCSIQKEDGAWFDCNDTEPYVFDSAQILKGLIAIRDVMPEVDSHIIRGCDWILRNMLSDGRLTTPSKDAWGNDENFCSELIHLYCLTPIRDAGVIFQKQEYLNAVKKILKYYKDNKIEQIKDFSMLSHFYAYVMEGLYDLGEIDLCRTAMENLEKYRNRKGAIPGLKDVPWVCSTGLFQLALVWYKLGELDKGNSLFYYGLKLQNKSGGWYGSYTVPSILNLFYKGKKKPYYFPDAEISWANKYFLDALYWKEKLEFEKQAPIFLNTIDEDDGRFILLKNILAKSSKENGAKLIVGDIGCGKGRYTKKLSDIFRNCDFYVSDISETVMSKIDFVKEKRLGTLTNINFIDNFFDFVYVCEAYEHAINLRGAFRELYRIIKPGGKFVIIDKPVEKLGSLEIYEWEQWISDDDMKQFTTECGGTIEIIKSVPYENKNDGLFRAWIIKKNKNK